MLLDGGVPYIRMAVFPHVGEWLYVQAAVLLRPVFSRCRVFVFLCCSIIVFPLYRVEVFHCYRIEAMFPSNQSLLFSCTISRGPVLLSVSVFR